jgi:hypothetical protein
VAGRQTQSRLDARLPSLINVHARSSGFRGVDDVVSAGNADFTSS